MLEHLKDVKRRNYGPGNCKLQRLMQGMTPDDLNILNECLSDRETYSTNGIYHGLRQAGLDVGYVTVQRHRDGLCHCGRNA